MAKNVSLLLGLGLVVALVSPIGSAMAQLAPPPGQADPNAEKKKAEEKKARPKAPEGQQPPKGPSPGVPGRGPGERPPRADGDGRGPQRPIPPRPPEQKAPRDIPAPSKVQPVPPKAQQPVPTPNVQQSPPAPKKEFLPKSNAVPQMKPRSNPTAPANQPPVPTVPGTPKGTPSGNVPEGVAPRNPGAPTLPKGAGNRVPPSQSAPPPAVPNAGTTTRPPAAAANTPLSTSPPPQAVSKIPAAVLPAAPKSAGGVEGFRPGFLPSGPAVQSLGEVQKGRTQRVEAGGKRTVIQETDNRIIIKQDNRTIIRHDETQRFAKNATDIRSQRRPDGTTQTVVFRPGGVQLFNIVDNSGRLVRRYRRDGGGREVNLIDNRRFYRNAGIGIGIGLAIGAVALALRPPEVRIDRAKYIVDYERASDDDVYEALSAAPIERLERRYSLDEVRFSSELRDRMRRVDLDAITFEFGSWDVGQEQFPKLERVAKVIRRITDQKPSEVFMIEGHTDAVGSDVDNLTLSDRRAQAVAEILSSVFGVPPENLVTQGYGEQYLKISTQDAERQNRRVAVRRITPLMSEGRE